MGTRHNDDYKPRNPGLLGNWDQLLNPRGVNPDNRNLIPEINKAIEKAMEPLKNKPPDKPFQRGIKKPVKMVTIKMTKSNHGSPDGYNVNFYEEGKVYAVSESLAENFIGQGCAILHTDPKNKKEKEK